MSGKVTGKILILLNETPALTIPELALTLNKSERTVEQAIRSRRKEGRLRRIGPRKGGHWEVVDD